MLKNKRGAGEDIWIIIAIVIGVLALVLIAVGFTTGWSNLWSKFNLFSGGKGSLSGAAEACTITCGKGDAGKTAWCSDVGELKGITYAQLSVLNSRLGLQNSTNALINLASPTKGHYNATSANPTKDVYISKSDTTAKQVTINGLSCDDLKQANLIIIDCDLSC